VAGPLISEREVEGLLAYGSGRQLPGFECSLGAASIDFAFGPVASEEQVVDFSTAGAQAMRNAARKRLNIQLGWIEIDTVKSRSD